jgi:hypothetical protein
MLIALHGGPKPKAAGLVAGFLCSAIRYMITVTVIIAA